MSNVKLVVRSPIGIPISNKYTIVDVRGIDRKKIMDMIFRNYRKLYVLVYNRQDLLVPDYAYFPQLKNKSSAEIEAFIGNNCSTRATTHDNMTYYDVYKLWYKTEDLPIKRLRTDWLFRHLFGGDDIVNVWGMAR